MAKWARIQDGLVAETTDLNPEGRYHPDLVWVSCGDDVGHNYTYDGKKFTAPPPPPATTAVDLAPGRSLDGLTAEEIKGLEDLAVLINTNADALRNATGANNV